MKRIWVVLAISLFAYPAVFGGLHFKTKQVVTTGNKKNGDVTLAEGWVDQESARIVFNETPKNQPMISKDSYMITNDGGKTFYLVNDKEKTYMVWDVDALVNMAGGMMEAMKGFMNIEVTDPSVQLLNEGKGEKIHGYNTKHYQYQTTYQIKTKVLGMTRISETITDQELWVTKDVKDSALGAWLRKEPPKTGNEDLDKLIAVEMKTLDGFPLKTITKTTTKQYNKKKTKVRDESTATNVMEVTYLKQKAIDSKYFQIPEGYTQQESLGSGEDEEEDGGGNFFQKLLKKKN